MNTRKVLLVGDIPDVEDELHRRDGGFEISRVQSGAEAIARLTRERFDVLVADTSNDPSQAWLDSLSRLPERPLVISPAQVADVPGTYENIDSSPTASKILNSIERAIEHANLLRENQSLRKALGERTSHPVLVGNSTAMQSVIERIDTVAASRANILVSGESGSGKEEVAREIHRRSGRNMPLVRASCDALPSGSFEAVLFGQAGRTSGLLEDCEDLLLEHVEALPRNVQSRLALAIEEGRYLNGERAVAFEPRILSTTTLDLKKEVERGNFREDLYYYLNVVPIDVPPLRERRSDIPLLAVRLAERFSGENRRETTAIGGDAAKKLSAAQWRGNVRELKNVIERAVLLSPGPVLGADDLRFDDDRDENLAQLTHAFRFGSVRGMEKLMIMNRLRELGDNRTRAAESLEISVRTLRNKLREYRSADARH